MASIEEGTLSVLTRGHYRIRVPDGPGPHPLLIGFHGYAQNAEENLADLLMIPGIDDWAVCAVQALHLFYRREDRVVGASWMTRFGRDEAIVDNLAYVTRLVASLRNRYPLEGPLVYAGFSQGVAIAYRAASGSGHRSDGMLILVGDVPPELTAARLSALGPILLGCGRSDKLYDRVKMNQDLARLRGASVEVESVLFDGGHEWHGTYLEQSGAFLTRVRQNWQPVRTGKVNLDTPTTTEDVAASDDSRED